MMNSRVRFDSIDEKSKVKPDVQITYVLIFYENVSLDIVQSKI